MWICSSAFVTSLKQSQWTLFYLNFNCNKKNLIAGIFFPCYKVSHCCICRISKKVTQFAKQLQQLSCPTFPFRLSPHCSFEFNYLYSYLWTSSLLLEILIKIKKNAKEKRNKWGAGMLWETASSVGVNILNLNWKFLNTNLKKINTIIWKYFQRCFFSISCWQWYGQLQLASLGHGFLLCWFIWMSRLT